MSNGTYLITTNEEKTEGFCRKQEKDKHTHTHIHSQTGHDELCMIKIITILLYDGKHREHRLPTLPCGRTEREREKERERERERTTER